MTVQNAIHVLLMDDDISESERVNRILVSRHLRVELARDVAQAEAALRSPVASYQLAVINVSDPRKSWAMILDRLLAAHRASGRLFPLFFLCVSTVQREPRFQLELERKGARYVFAR